MKLGTLDPKFLLLAGGLVILAYAFSRGLATVPAALATVGRALDPSSSENIVNRGVSAVVATVTGRDETLGGWLYDITHADPMAAGPPALATPPWGPLDTGYTKEW